MDAPPLLVSFPDLVCLQSALKPETLAEHREELQFLLQKALPPAVSRRVVATLFGYSVNLVGRMGARPANYYRTFVVGKGRGVRKIDSPKVALKVIQKWIGEHLSLAIEMPQYVHGFVPNRSTLTGALPHCGAQWVASVDIKDFFPSIAPERLRPELARIGYQDKAQETILNLTTLHGGLPQGSPASPVLANLAFRRTDELVSEFCSEVGCTYTRYADDLVVSAKRPYPDKLLERLSTLVEGQGWRISQQKARVWRDVQHARVYGLLVHGSTPRLPKPYRNQLRLYRYMLEHGEVPDDQLMSIQGHLAYAAAVQAFEQNIKPQ